MATARQKTEPDRGWDLLRVMSDRWNTLIVREVSFGTNRFGELQRAIGIAPNVLTGRLNGLVAADLLVRHQYRADKPWYEYHLTEKAAEVVPAWLMIARIADPDFGAPGGQRRELLHAACGQVTTPVVSCGICLRPIRPGEVSYREQDQ